MGLTGSQGPALSTMPQVKTELTGLQSRGQAWAEGWQKEREGEGTAGQANALC